MAREARDTVNDYLTDMLALEDRIEKALKDHIEEFADEHPDVIAKLRPIHTQCDHHIAELKDLLESRKVGFGKRFAEGVKRFGTAFAGFGAAAIDLVRNEKLPKSLRDDYTTLNLALIGYVTLFTTARALDANKAADLAERHFRHYAQAVMTVHDLIPATVVTFLRDEKLPVQPDILPEVHRTLDEIWRSVSAPVGEFQHFGVGTR